MFIIVTLQESNNIKSYYMHHNKKLYEQMPVTPPPSVSLEPYSYSDSTANADPLVSHVYNENISIRSLKTWTITYRCLTLTMSTTVTFSTQTALTPATAQYKLRQRCNAPPVAVFSSFSPSSFIIFLHHKFCKMYIKLSR